MTAIHQLTFDWTAWSLAISVAIVLVTAVFSWIGWRRSGYRRSIGLLELSRMLLMVLAAIILNAPEWVEQFRPDEKPTIAVLWDDSASMNTRDVLQPNQTSSQPVSRHDAIAPLINPDAWQSLAEKYQVVIQPFSTAQAGHGTNLHDPLSEAPEKFKNLTGIVLASDGDWNEGPAPCFRRRPAPPEKHSRACSTRPAAPHACPMFPSSASTRPTFGIVNKSVRIPFTIDSSLPREYSTTVTLRSSNGDEVSKDIQIAPMGRTSDSIIWKPKETGDFTITLEVPKHSDETLTDNNKLSAPLSVREEKLRVLLVESYPRWEYRYLRNALSRDPGGESLLPAVSSRP